MPFIDIFAWIVLLVIIATAVAVFLALGMMLGHIARKRGHPWPEAVSVGSTGHAAIFTDRIKASHYIRKVVLRQTAILNYINPF